MRRDRFAAQVNRGTNLSILMRAKAWFQESDIDIVRYYYCIENKTRRAENLSKNSLHSCAVCGMKLYRLNVAEFDESFSHNDVSFLQKKYLLFEDRLGKQYRTCFGLNRCFTRVGWVEPKDAEIDFEIVPPTFEELLDVDLEAEAQDDLILSMILEDAEASYKKYVSPFIAKWLYAEVTKHNVSEFMSDLRSIEPHFIYYEDELTASLVRDKILKVVGVYNGQYKIND